MATKKFNGLNNYKVTYKVEDSGNQVDLVESALGKYDIVTQWIVIDKGEQLDWIIEQLQAIQKGA